MKLLSKATIPASHPYLTNKYTYWYYSIISQARQRNLAPSLSEKHHIIPECLFATRTRKGRSGYWPGNPNEKTNLVKLSTREHYICHLLLTKMVHKQQDQFRMNCALGAFQRINKRNPVLTAAQVSRVRAAAILARKGQKSWMKDGIKIYSSECPGEEWLNQNSTKGTNSWMKDGQLKFSKICPGEGWLPQGPNAGKTTWVKDGLMKFSVESPGEGWTRSGLTSGLKSWIKDGRMKFSAECPGDGWVNSGACAGKSPWYKDGITIWSVLSPGEGWAIRGANKGRKSWTDGHSYVFSVSCPGEGWYRKGPPRGKKKAG